MVMTLAYAGQTETTISLTPGAASAGSASLQWQYSTRRDFQYCVAPMFTSAVSGATLAIGALNRAQTYWFRVREVLNDGSFGAWSNAVAATTLLGVDTRYVPNVQIQPALIVVPQQPTAWGAQGTAAGFSPDNAGRANPAAAWRGSMGAGAILYIETTGQPIDTIALLDTNLPEGSTVRFFGGSTALKAQGQAPDSATGQVPFRASPNLRGRRGYHGLFRLATPITDRYVGVYFENAQPPGGIVHITHAVFGQARVIKNYSDRNEQPMDLGTFERLRDGTPDAVPGFRMRKLDFTLSMLTEEQHEAAFADLAGLVGTNEPVLVVPNSKAGPYLHDRLLYGNLTQSRGSDSSMRFERALTVESIINP